MAPAGSAAALAALAGVVVVAASPAVAAALAVAASLAVLAVLSHVPCAARSTAAAAAASTAAVVPVEQHRCSLGARRCHPSCCGLCWSRPPSLLSPRSRERLTAQASLLPAVSQLARLLLLLQAAL